MRMTPMSVAVLGLAVVAVLSGCGGSGSPSPSIGPSASSGAASTDGPVMEEPRSPEGTEQGIEQPGQEPPGYESPELPESGEVVLHVPDLPIGREEVFNQEVFNQEDGGACVDVGYLGGGGNPIPDGAQITITDINFKPDILKVGGSGCRGGNTCQTSEPAFTAEDKGCVLPVQFARDPKPSDNPDGDDDVDVTMTIDSAVHCPPAQRQECDDFVRDLMADLDAGVLDPVTITITILLEEPDTGDTDTPTPGDTDTPTPGDTDTPTPGDPGTPSG